MEYPSDHYKLIEELKTRNFIKSTSIARVMKEVDRADYVDMLPYTDWFPHPFSKFKFKSPSPIGYSANISAPHMDAICLVHSNFTHQLILYIGTSKRPSFLQKESS
jgi:protein-L-isoaspartate O-methyltransferase